MGERACRCEQLALDEETTRVLGGDLHAVDGIGEAPSPRAFRDPVKRGAPG
jgi:hypothetical protein